MDHVVALPLIIKLNLLLRSQGVMYQHAKRDVHIFSEPRSQLKVNQRGLYPILNNTISLLTLTPYLTGATAGPPRTPPLNYPGHQNPRSVQSRISVHPQQPEAVTPSPAPVVLDSHFGYPLASADGVVF